MVALRAHAVLLVDQARWHLSARLVIPANITILPMPPKSPELNPVENIRLPPPRTAFPNHFVSRSLM
jgi:transposase